MKLSSDGSKRAKQSPELHHALLPHHQWCDVTEGAEGTSGVGTDHNIDAGETAIEARAIPHLTRMPIRWRSAAVVLAD